MGMHSSHQPAAMNVAGMGNLESTGGNGTWADDLVAHPDKDDAASNYGALDSTDVRRLSFISFSDIVQSEHAEHAGSRDSIYVAGLSSLSSGNNRSPSPIRSPVSSQGFSASDRWGVDDRDHDSGLETDRERRSQWRAESASESIESRRPV